MFGFKKNCGGKRQKFANGGLVRGPGTDISDEIPDEVPPGTYIMPADSTQSIGPQNLAQMGQPRGFQPRGKKIPVQLSNGEYKIPPEQVQAIGEQTLEQMRAATHTPVPQGANIPAEEQPMFFANGGVVDDERRKLGFPMRERDVRGAQIAQANEQAAQRRAAWQADYEANGPAAAQAAREAAGMRQYNAAVRPYRPDTMSQAGAGRGFVNPAAVRAPAVAAPAAALDAAIPKSGSQAAEASANPGTAAVQQPAQATPASAPAQAGRMVAPGVYQHGRGQYSDSAEGMGFRPGFTGQPSAQNMATADALDARYRAAAGFQPPAEQQQGGAFIPQDTGGYGLLDKGYRERRAAMMDAQMMKPGARLALAALLKEQGAQNDRLAQSAESALDRGFRSRENALDRGLRQNELVMRGFESEYDRALRARELADREATSAVQREAQGIGVAEAKQMQELRNKVLNGKTPEERQEAAQQLQFLTGKTSSAKDNFMVVGGGQEWDAAAGAMRNVPQRLIDLRTGREVGGGQQEQVPAAPSDKASRQVGANYVLPNGRIGRWTDKGWLLVG